ncbi:MAG: biotin--[acetyl-CoA-carboxylase] ligase [Geodermatophilaceae bacterium]|nr:biotin--[acetyl-CoA-carboxylase] ligase [Geodermatophilaceae bacterium]
MYADLGRPPLAARALAPGLVGGASIWHDIRVVGQTGSTNADLAEAARDGAAEGLVLIAEEQVRGRGRLARDWNSPPQAGLTLSVLLRPRVPRAGWGWLPLLAGVSLATAVAEVAELPTFLKWPNDLLLGEGRGKAAGILAEVAEDAVVLGLGLNVSTRRDELPHGGATSLAVEGATRLDRATVLRAVLRGLDQRYRAWSAADGDAIACGLHRDYETLCDTLGRDVRVALPSGELHGRAEGIDATGRLLVRDSRGGVHPLAAGDVTHVRPT